MGKVRQENWVVAVRHCARCGQDHERVVFEKFHQPVVDDDGTAWEWHGVCPVTSEPILMRETLVQMGDDKK